MEIGSRFDGWRLCVRWGLRYDGSMKIVFPEFEHEIIQAALEAWENRQVLATKLDDLGFDSRLVEVEGVPAADLAEACAMLKNGEAAAMVAGIDFDSREVILACRDGLGMAPRPEELTKVMEAGNYRTFSGLAVMRRKQQTYLLADMAACKHPTAEQLTEIVWQTYESALKLLIDEPRIALLSFSTLGSGGHDDVITTLQEVKGRLSSTGILVDGEMQLDAAINPRISAKKAPHSLVAGQANVLIAPDLDAGNLLYKAFEQVGDYTVAGPILQGFRYPVADLSRGSTVEDVLLTIEMLVALGV